MARRRTIPPKVVKMGAGLGGAHKNVVTPPSPPPVAPTVGKNQWAVRDPATGNESLALQKKAFLESNQRRKNVRVSRLADLSRRKYAKVKGLGLAGLGAGVATAGLSTVYGMNRDAMIRDAIRDLTRRQEDLKVAEARRQGQEASYESAINMNLQRLARSAPDLYASVAAGRKLPQGGVVIGGAPRQDLLNELGRAMADGRFSR